MAFPGGAAQPGQQRAGVVDELAVTVEAAAQITGQARKIGELNGRLTPERQGSACTQEPVAEPVEVLGQTRDGHQVGTFETAGRRLFEAVEGRRDGGHRRPLLGGRQWT